MRMEFKRRSEATAGYMGHDVYNTCPICLQRLFKEPGDADTSPREQKDDHACLGETPKDQQLLNILKHDPPRSCPDASTPSPKNENGTVTPECPDEPVIFIGTQAYRVKCISKWIMRQLEMGLEKPIPHWRPWDPCGRRLIKAGEMLEVLSITKALEDRDKEWVHKVMFLIRGWAMDDLTLLTENDTTLKNDLRRGYSLGLDPKTLRLFERAGAIDVLGGDVRSEYFPYGTPFSENELRSVVNDLSHSYFRFRAGRQMGDPSYWRRNTPPPTASNIMTSLDNQWKQLFIVMQALFVTDRRNPALYMESQLAMDLVNVRKFMWTGLYESVLHPLLKEYSKQLWFLCGSHTAQIAYMDSVEIAYKTEGSGLDRVVQLWGDEQSLPHLYLGDYLLLVHWMQCMSEAMVDPTVMDRPETDRTYVMKVATPERYQTYCESGPHHLLFLSTTAMKKQCPSGKWEEHGQTTTLDAVPMRWWSSDEQLSTTFGRAATWLDGNECSLTFTRPAVLTHLLTTIIPKLKFVPEPSLPQSPATEPVDVLRTFLASILNAGREGRNARQKRNMTLGFLERKNIERLHHLAVWTLTLTTYMEKAEFGNYEFWYPHVKAQNETLEESFFRSKYEYALTRHDTLYAKLATPELTSMVGGWSLMTSRLYDMVTPDLRNEIVDRVTREAIERAAEMTANANSDTDSGGE